MVRVCLIMSSTGTVNVQANLAEEPVTTIALPEKDLLSAGRLMYRAVNAVRKQCALPALTTRLRKPDPLMQHLYSQAGDYTWGAYVGDELRGFIMGSIRDQHCHFPYFCVDPAYWQNGIGGQLLSVAVQEATKRNLHFISGSLPGGTIGAMGLYARNNLYPRKNIFLMRHEKPQTITLPRRGNSLNPEPITTIDILSDMNRLDREIRGANRSLDHCYWLADDHLSGYVYYANERHIGYAYIHDRGAVGPVLVSRDQFLTEVIVHCLRELATMKPPQFSVWVSGKNFATIDLLLSLGFEFAENNMLMANRMFCDTRRYLPQSMVIF